MSVVTDQPGVPWEESRRCAEAAGQAVWILSRLNAVAADADSCFDDYQSAKLSGLVYHFAWDETFD